MHLPPNSPEHNENVPAKIISIKDAAQMLNVPAWRLYRMDRAAGPFRFVQRGRRVFIDLDSLQTRVVTQPRPDPNHGGPEMQRSIDIKYQEPGSEVERVELQDLQEDGPVRSDSRLPSGSGQRELRFPVTRGHFGQIVTWSRLA